MESTKALGPERRAPAVWGSADEKGSRNCDPGGGNDPETRHDPKEGTARESVIKGKVRPNLYGVDRSCPSFHLCWFSDTIPCKMGAKEHRPLAGLLTRKMTPLSQH
jgi:hypothetical protein